jgi:iron complex transport system ATP-binding protein
LLSADNVGFAYGERRGPHRGATFELEGVSLSAPRGQIVGILGPNGSGKTTLLKLLAGILTPSAGHLRLDGQDLRNFSRAEVARRLAVVPQHTSPAFDYTALEIVLMGRYPHLAPFEIEGPDDLQVARAAMDATGTGALDHRRFDTLSGGEQQRVAIASALAQTPSLLLLDEPTSSLDLAYQLEIAALIARLNEDRGVTIVLSTHDLNFAASVCHALVLLRDGRVAASGPIEQALTPDTIREVYGVDADVTRHDRAGHLTVVPVRHLGAAR